MNKKWFSLTGLIIGSLTPDFEYFIRMKILSIHSHTLWGVLWFNLPLGILMCFIFHQIISDNLFQNLPLFLKSRLMIFTNFNWVKYFKSNWIVVIYSIIIGAFSHLFWDSFTHEDGYFVEHFYCLKNSILIFGNTIFVFKILQHSSSILGAFVILYAILKLPKKELKNSQINLKYWYCIFTITILILSLKFAFGMSINAFGNIIVSGLSTVIVALIITPFLIQKK